MKKRLSLLFLTLISFCVQATEIEWNFNSKYPVTASGFASIIDEARTHFNTFPNDTILVRIDAGTYEIDGGNNIGINFNGGLLSANAQGRLIFQGAGMYETTLIFTDKNDDMIKGRDTYHLEFRDMFMTRSQYSVTQGTIVSVSPGEVVLDIAPGFPSPLDLYATPDGAGRYEAAGRFLRKYDNSNKLDPLVIQNNNQQVSWGWRDGAPAFPEKVDGTENQWRIYLNNANNVVSYYSPGDYIGVKSKSEGHIYWFINGSDLVFRNIRWRNSSRGLVRGGFSNVGLYGCRIEREDPINGQAPCLSTPSGGPQMNQNGVNEPLSTNMVVEDCYFDSPGDDNVAFFYVDGGRVKNTVIRNGFARGVLGTARASNICLDNVTLENAYIEDGPLGIDHATEEEAVAAGGAFNDDCVEGPAQTASFFQMFANDMVLQRNTSVKIWGSGVSGTEVKITTSWNGTVYTSTVDNNGQWEVFVNTPNGSYNAYTIKLETPDSNITLTDVLIGEVWLASGQSNMVRPLRSSLTGDADASANPDPYLRMWKTRDRHPDGTNHDISAYTDFNVHDEPQNELHESFDGWDRGDENASNRNMTAVGWYFARQLRDKLDMPVGIIMSAVGSTPVEAWLDKETASQFPWLNLTAKIGDAGIQPQHVPSVCYNGMIHPMLGFTIKGVVWYQGESSGAVAELDQNKAMYNALIESWRRLWGIGDFSFNLVQITPKFNNQEPLKIPIFSNMLREIIYSTDNTGMVITIDKLPTSASNPDVIDCDQVHPYEKKYIGERLGYWVLNKQYGFSDIVASGPIATHAESTDNTVTVYFDYAETGLVETSGNGFKNFELAGADEVFHSASVQLNADNTLTLSSNLVTEPKFVRYGYIECFDLEAQGGVTFFNGANLPASAFLLEVNGGGSNNNEGAEIKLYPNPVKDKLFIEGINNELPFEIFNTLGELVKSAYYDGSIDVSYLSQGLYILRQEGFSIKFIKK